MRSGILDTRVERCSSATLVSRKRRIQKIAEQCGCGGWSAGSRTGDCEGRCPSEIDFDAIVLEFCSPERIIGRDDDGLHGCDDLTIRNRSTFGEKSNSASESNCVPHDEIDARVQSDSRNTKRRWRDAE